MKSHPKITPQLPNAGCGQKHILSERLLLGNPAELVLTQVGSQLSARSTDIHCHWTQRSERKVFKIGYSARGTWRRCRVGVVPCACLTGRLSETCCLTSTVGGLRAEDRAARYDFASRDPITALHLVAVVGDSFCGFATVERAAQSDAPDFGSSVPSDGAAALASLPSGRLATACCCLGTRKLCYGSYGSCWECRRGTVLATRWLGVRRLAAHSHCTGRDRRRGQMQPRPETSSRAGTLFRATPAHCSDPR